EFDREHPKSMVSCGLVRFLTLDEHAHKRVENIACSVNYTREPIGLFNPASNELLKIIPEWTPTTTPNWFPFDEGPVQDYWQCDDDKKIHLYTKRNGTLRLLGIFDLNGPGMALGDEQH